jgi:hypothetical protein
MAFREPPGQTKRAGIESGSDCLSHEWEELASFSLFSGGTLLTKKLRRIFVFCVAALACPFSVASGAQQLEQRPTEQSSAQSNGQSQGENADNSAPKFDPETGGSNDRLFWTLPNFLTLENAHGVAPLSSAQKFKLVAKTSFDPVEFPFYAFLAGISQADNSESGYGQGGIGYGKRFGSNFLDGTTETFFAQAIFPSIFRQDPRYYQDGKATFWRRAGYAVSRTGVTRNDSGRMRFNISEFAGAAAAAALSNTYHPASDRSVTNTMETWVSMMGWDTVSNVLKEFWPDIRRKVHQRKDRG